MNRSLSSRCLFPLLLSLAPTFPAEATEVAGTIAVDTTWTAAGNPWIVTGDVAVAASATLSIEAGVRVELEPRRSILAQAGGGLSVWGDIDNPVLFRPHLDGENWGRIGAEGNGARVTLRHADAAFGQGVVLDGASGLFEFCFFHEYTATSGGPSFSQPILVSNYADSLVVRGCHFRDYYETNFRHGVIVVEDSLFEDVRGDAIDFDVAAPGSIIRRCTFRHGNATNVDAVDLGSDTQGTEIIDCLIYDFPFDKGVSIGEKSSNIVVRSCVIYNVDTGIAVKDSSQALIVNNTIIGADIALRLYQKVSGQGPGYATARNNILWDNALAVELLDGSVLSLTYSDVEGSYFGDGNLNANPQFWNAASNDFRLAVDSPCVGTGENGATMGALFPVGSFLVDTDRDGLPDTWETTYGLNAHDPDDAAHDGDDDGAPNQDEFVAGTAPDDPDSVLKVSAVLPGPQGVKLQFEAVDSQTYTLQYRDAPGMEGWQALTDVPASATTTNVTVSDADADTAFRRFYRLVTPALPRP